MSQSWCLSFLSSGNNSTKKLWDQLNKNLSSLRHSRLPNGLELPGPGSVSIFKAIFFQLIATPYSATSSRIQFGTCADKKCFLILEPYDFLLRKNRFHFQATILFRQFSAQRDSFLIFFYQSLSKSCDKGFFSWFQHSDIFVSVSLSVIHFRPWLSLSHTVSLKYD